MKKNHLLWTLCLAAVAVVGFTGCDDKEDPVETVYPRVTLTEGPVSGSSVTFSAIPSNAVACACLCVEDGAVEPSAEDILKSGEALPADRETTRTVSGLKPETGYVILAAASNREAVSLVAKLKMTTTKGGVAEDATVVLTAGEAKATRLSFIVESAHAVQCAYLCVEATEDVPDGATVLKEGVAVAVNKATTVEVKDLKPKTEYLILAAATNGEKVAEARPLSMTTSEDSGEVLEILSVTKKSVTYRVTVADAPDGILHLPVSAETLDDLLFSKDGLGIDPNDGQAVLDGKLKVLSNMGRYTPPGEFTVTDGEPYTPPYGTETPSELLAGMDYKLLAAVSDRDAWALAPLYEMDFRTPEPERSAATATIAVDEITQTSVRLKITPSSDAVAFYFYSFLTAEAGPIVAADADGLRRITLVKGSRLSSPAEGGIEKLTPETSYTILCVLIDSEGDQALVTREFTTAPATTTDLKLGVEAFTTDEYPGYKAFNTIFYTVRTTDAVAISSCVLTRTETDRQLAEGMTYEQIARGESSTEWSAEEVETANMDEGCRYFRNNCTPETAYAVVVRAEDENGTVLVKHTDISTEAEPVVLPVTSDLFEKLPGTWTGTMTVRISGGGTEVQNFSVQIAPGVDPTTEADYRARTRLVCLGLGSLHYYSPEEMMEDYYYQAHPEEVWEDYGPKWFLQIAENDAVTVPVSVSGPNLYQMGNSPTYLLPTRGDDRGEEGEFPVVVAGDFNTITVQPIENDGAWYPSVVTLSNWGDRRNLDVVSAVVLTRTAGAAPQTGAAAGAGVATKTANARFDGRGQAAGPASDADGIRSARRTLPLAGQTWSERLHRRR